ncbi:hypothetical protein H4582DRAFT_2072722 [Lactarius indigo]|nr:hypothetical protein H4582DRAFT_2072722 [Lactarius indigo]
MHRAGSSFASRTSRPAQALSLFDLLMALCEMPLLEVLRIEHIRDVWDETDPPLRHLSLLSFHDTTPRRLVILSSRIDAPSTPRRQLVWQRGGIRSWFRLANMFTGVPALVPPDSAPFTDDDGLRVAHVTGGSDRGSLDVWFRTGSGSASASAREDGLFLFHVSWFGGAFDQRANDPSARPSTFSFFSLAQTLIDIANGHSASDAAKQWKALLTALPSVKTLRMHCNSECVSALRVLSASVDPLLLHLQRVFVVHCTVHCAVVAALPDSVGATDAVANREVNVGAELVEAVSARSGLEVVLVGCAVDDEALESLEKRAQVVIVRTTLTVNNSMTKLVIYLIRVRK